MPVGATIAATTVAAGSAVADNRNAKKSIKSQERQREDSQAFIERQIERARGDLFKLYPDAQRSRRLGAQAGLNLLGQSIPKQIEAFQGGNVAAQNMLMQGLPQAQNAILGRGTAFNPQSIRLGGEITIPTLPDPIEITGAE
jgi:hypothetical protein